MVLHRYVVASAPHVQDIGPVLERLGEIAYVADYVVVAFEGERKDGDEAERKPRVALDDMGGIVATVMALAGDALVALDLFAEGMLAASED